MREAGIQGAVTDPEGTYRIAAEAEVVRRLANAITHGVHVSKEEHLAEQNNLRFGRD